MRSESGGGIFGRGRANLVLTCLLTPWVLTWLVIMLATAPVQRSTATTRHVPLRRERSRCVSWATAIGAQQVTAQQLQQSVQQSQRPELKPAGATRWMGSPTGTPSVTGMAVRFIVGGASSAMTLQQDEAAARFDAAIIPAPQPEL